MKYAFPSKGCTGWLGLLLMLFFFQACVSPYDFEAIGTPQAIVIDASLTNEEKAHLVKLSYAESLDSSTFRSIGGARVSFIHADERTRLIEIGEGVYRTDSSFFGIPGNTYQLEVVLEGGEEFVSNEEVMPFPVPIDSIYGEYIIVPNDRNVRFQNGVQFFLDAHSSNESQRNFKYEFQESFAIDVPYPSQYDFRGSGDRFEVIERERPLDRCYRTRPQSRTIIETTSHLKENRIAQLPITFVNESLPDLAYAYRLGVRQYALTDGAYYFFRQLRDTNESSGSLSDRQLGVLQSNIFPSEGTNLTVLGYFEVAGVTEVRRTFNYKEFLADDIKTEEWVCQNIPDEGCQFSGETAVPIQFTREAFHIFFGDTTFLTIPYIDYVELEAAVKNPMCGSEWRITHITEGGLAYIAHMFCSDCTEFGLYERPEVWEEL